MKLQFALLLAVATLLNHAAPAAAAVEARDLALEVAKVYPSPAAAPIEDAVVLIQHGRIAALGKRSEEFEYMGRAMAWRDVLASLTSNPSTCSSSPEKGAWSREWPLTWLYSTRIQRAT
jgi:hypothetical protein